jgi:transcriptional regulator with XRE-family HTH domain
MSLDWKLKSVLEQHNITVYRLADVSGVPRNTLYNLVNKEPARVDLGTLNAVLDALDELTGTRVNVADLLERDDEAFEFPGEVPADIRERIERFERGETKLIPAGDIAAKYGVKR